MIFTKNYEKISFNDKDKWTAIEKLLQAHQKCYPGEIYNKKIREFNDKKYVEFEVKTPSEESFKQHCISSNNASSDHSYVIFYDNDEELARHRKFIRDDIEHNSTIERLKNESSFTK